MLRLSQRGWNNVIMFSMLVMILLFTSMSNILNGDARSTAVPHTLLPKDSMLLTLDFGVHKIERVGRGWRISSAQNGQAQDVQALLEAWHGVQLSPVDAPMPRTYNHVRVWLAGEERERDYLFYMVNDLLLVFIDGQAYQIHGAGLNQLLPEER